MQEGVAFTILLKLMEGEGFVLHELYGESLKLLFEFSDCVYSWLLSEQPKLEMHLSKCGIPLTTMLASPFMALFANISSQTVSLSVLDRLILYKTDALIDIIKLVLTTASPYLLKLTESDLLH